MGRTCKQDFVGLLQVAAWKVNIKNRKIERAGLGVVRVESSPTVFLGSAWTLEIGANALEESLHGILYSL